MNKSIVMIQSILKEKKLPFEIIRFILGGCTTAVVTFGSYWLMTDALGIRPVLSVILSTLLAWCYSFVINKALVFLDNRKEKALRQGTAFIMLQVTLLFFSCVIMFVAHDLFGANDKMIVIACAVVNAVLNFLGMKLFVFKNVG